ncbi:Long-chain-fatty-acid--CoA ligase 2 [Erysiphe necator]|uniref:Putative acyl-synthetase n=1 Tax=Uncinula necator TaxID=52586 RepID=A0A0B1PCE1_UNCNE|nr:Long-chain-fatty-acid--CoA ligase 2 [Erysiphe necator]KHJ34284.1 putative acyl- synthetase [Erysiphe necator]
MYRYATTSPGIYDSPPFSIAIKSSENATESCAHRHPARLKGLVAAPRPEISTIYDILVHSATNYKDLPGFGSRKLIKLHREIKKTKKIVDGEEITEEKEWTTFEMGPYEYLTYGQYSDMALTLGAGLRSLGLVAKDKVHIFAGTSMSWLAMAHAAASQSLPIVTSYATLGEEGLTTSLTQTKASAIFTDPDLLSKLINPLKVATHVKFVIYNDQNKLKDSDIELLREAHPNLRILSLSALQQVGTSNPTDPVPPSPDDLACVMYTSGSTGIPKGVSLTHKNVIAAVAGINSVFYNFLTTEDSILAYLPLSHIFEYTYENTCMFWGLRIGYGNPRTLSALSMHNCEGDIKTFAPTILIGVPAVWETLRKGIEAKVSGSGRLKRSVFHGALRTKEFICERSLPGAEMVSNFAFSAILEGTGGRLRVCLNGAGALDEKTIKFISYNIAPLVAGYGLTETCAMGTVQSPLQWSPNSVGAPVGCTEIKLLSHPDLGYYADRTPPRGEILIRGPSVMQGYYENEEETRKVFLKGGWFRTGDVGEWDVNGHLKIIDRVKNLIKMLGGEYVALEKLESVYRTSPLVLNVCIHAESNFSRPTAIISPSIPAITSLAAGHGLDSSSQSLTSFLNSGSLKNLVLRELQNVGRKAGLASFEVIDYVVIVEEEWTPESGLVTPAMKLKRREIIDRYGKYEKPK